MFGIVTSHFSVSVRIGYCPPMVVPSQELRTNPTAVDYGRRLSLQHASDVVKFRDLVEG